MDLHALTQGRTMLMVRGGIAFLAGIILSNQPGVSASTLLLVWGLWALAEGAATIRQAYPPTGKSQRSEARPVLVILGGVAVAAGLLAILGLGLSTGALTLMLAGWLALRAALEGLGAYAARSRARALLGAAMLVDLGLVAMFLIHDSGSGVGLAMYGGGLAAVWGALYLWLGLTADRVVVVTAPGPRLLTAH